MLRLHYRLKVECFKVIIRNTYQNECKRDKPKIINLHFYFVVFFFHFLIFFRQKISGHQPTECKPRNYNLLHFTTLIFLSSQDR